MIDLKGHAASGFTNPKRDHLVDPIWIGRSLAVKGEVLGEDDEAEEALEVNTHPTVEV